MNPPRKIISIHDISLIPYGGGAGIPNPRVSFRFKMSDAVYEGVPIIVGGEWSIDAAKEISKLDVLVQVSVESYLEHANTTKISQWPKSFNNIVPVVDCENDLDLLEDALKLPYTKPSFARINCECDTVYLREVHPALTVFAGNYITIADAEIQENEWVDAVVLGAGSSNDDFAQNMGFRVDHFNLIAACDHTKIAHFGFLNPGDIVKAFALGAHFVEIGPSIKVYTVEQIINSLAAACYMLGATNPHDLPKNVGIGLN